MFKSLGKSPQELLTWDWPDYEPYAKDLVARELNAESIDPWLHDWSRFDEVLMEVFNRLSLATTQNTADKEAEKRYTNFVDNIYPAMLEVEQQLKVKLLESNLEPRGFEIPLRDYKVDASIFRDENLPLLSEEARLNLEYDQIVGKQTVEWDDKEITPTQLRPVYQEQERDRREQAWRKMTACFLSDRQSLNDLWIRLFDLRTRLAANAGEPEFRSYAWKLRHRHDYTPQDCITFQNAIEEVVVPVAERIYARRKERLGLDRLRPWDLEVDSFKLPALHPYQSIDELKAKTARIFEHVDPDLGNHFKTMIREELLDLDNRMNKAPGGYCTFFPITRRPFIFANAVGIHDDVQTLLHESGHAFHVFEFSHIPLMQLLDPPMEFNEVASMSMEFLGGPYLAADQGGFYSPIDAARAFRDHLETSILFWPYMAVVDGFQHWAYTNPQKGADPAACDAAWDSLWQRFMKGVDWSGLEQERMTGWHRKLHIFQVPFYYVEYGLAQLGAGQVWRNSLQDPHKAVADYRTALSLGGTVGLPALFQAAGARFSFEAGPLREVVTLMEEKLEELETRITG